MHQSRATQVRLDYHILRSMGGNGCGEESIPGYCASRVPYVGVTGYRDTLETFRAIRVDRLGGGNQTAVKHTHGTHKLESGDAHTHMIDGSTNQNSRNVKRITISTLSACLLLRPCRQTMTRNSSNTPKQ